CHRTRLDPGQPERRARRRIAGTERAHAAHGRTLPGGAEQLVRLWRQQRLGDLRAGGLVTGGADVVGLALWAAGQPPAAAAAAARPAGRPRRRTSLLTQMVSEVAAQAAMQAGLSLAGPRIVVGSAFGELGLTVEMLGEW